MTRMRPLLEVEALQPLDGRRTAITWMGHDWRLEGDNHANHGGSDSGPDGFDIVAAALGQCLLTTLLADLGVPYVAVRLGYRRTGEPLPPRGRRPT